MSDEKPTTFVHLNGAEIELVRSTADFYLRCSLYEEAIDLYAVLVFAGESPRDIYMYLARATLGNRQYEKAYNLAKKTYSLIADEDKKDKKAIAVIACKALWELGRHQEARDVLLTWV